MWKRDWNGSESELESEPIFPSPTRSRSRSRWNLVDSAALIEIVNMFSGRAATVPPRCRPRESQDARVNLVLVPPAQMHRDQ